MATMALPDPLEEISALLGPDCVVRVGTVETASDAKGAYALIMHFGAPVSFLYRQAPTVLDAGWYAYAGSAYGPGGVRARLRRHFRRDKKQHWHIDRLTGLADVFQAAVMEGGSECGIVSRLMASGAFDIPLDGFGSSDCRACHSHLLKWRPCA